MDSSVGDIRLCVRRTADSAYAILEGQPIDVIVLDLLIPQISRGTLALAITRRWPRLLGRVVFMSGEPSRIERLELHSTTWQHNWVLSPGFVFHT